MDHYIKKNVWNYSVILTSNKLFTFKAEGDKTFHF